MESLDIALDDIISQINKKGQGPRRDNNRGRSNFRRGIRSRPRPTSSSSFQNQRSNVNGNWSHDLYNGGSDASNNRGSDASRVSVAQGPTKLNISNLEYGVSDSDIKELFNEFGVMRSAEVHYDRSGRSLGSAHVIFANNYEAQKAIKQYNGVLLDGRKMSIVIDGESKVVSNSNGSSQSNNFRRGRDDSRPVKRLQGGQKGMFGNAAKGSGRRGRGSNTKTSTPTAEELDAELDAYIEQGGKK